MIKANHSLRGKLVSDLYSGYKLNKAFKTVRYAGQYTDNNLPVLMIANHFCWWDGFIQYRLNKSVFKKKFHVMMLEEQLKSNMILNGGGAFSIKKNSRDILETLRYCVDVMKDKDNLILIFPQGEIQSIYTPVIGFEKGLSYLFRQIENEFQLVFNVNLIDYFSDNKPSLTINYMTYDPALPLDLAEVQSSYNEYTAMCKKQQIAYDFYR